MSENKNEQEIGNALADADIQMKHYWIYAPGEGAYMWENFYKEGIMAIGWGEIGNLNTFATKEEMKGKLKETFDPEHSYRNVALATWQFVNEMKPGDIIFVKKGMHEIIGRGVVTSDYRYDESVDSEFKNIRQVNWIDKGSWKHNGQAAMKTLTDITALTDYVEQLKTLFENDLGDEIEDAEEEYPTYTRENFLNDVYMDEESYDTLVGLIKKKKNVILQGAPGVGKTYTAKRLAYSIIGHKNQERVMLVQFHQSYSYEDFIEGYRPTKNGGFDIKKGSFYSFCKRAEENPDKDFFFIIDEINRGNLSKIFGELFMLIECDKRGNSLQLLYSDEKFNVPPNVYLIGMMNTADRSLAMLDYALRRRFAFYNIKPGFESEGFKKYRTLLKSSKFDKLISCILQLNDVISLDESLGEGFCIGHSHFCDISEVSNRILKDIVEYELIPLLKEYWFDEPQKVEDWTDNLRRAIN